MSHTTNKIYVDTSTNPDTGISIEDIKAVLGESSNYLGTLCRSDNINRWAKHKPFRLAKVGIPTSTEKKTALWGLRPPAGNDEVTIKASFAAAAGDQNAYLYDKPTGGLSSSPYRQLDFDGYFHDSAQPIQDLIIGDRDDSHPYGDGIIDLSIITPGQGAAYEVILQKNNDSSDGGLNLADILDAAGIDDYYLAVGFLRGTTFYYRTSSGTLGTWAANSNSTIIGVQFALDSPPFDNIGSSAVTESLYVVAAENRYYGSDSEPASQTFYALPFENYVQGCREVTVKNDVNNDIYTLLKVGSYVPSNPAQSTPSFSNYTAIDNYLAPSGSILYPWQTLSNQGPFGICFSIKNGGNSPIYLYKNKIQMQATLNAYDWQYPTQVVSPMIFYSTSESGPFTWLQQDNDYVQVPSTGTKTLYLILCYGSFLGRSSHETGAKNITSNNGSFSFDFVYDGVSKRLQPDEHPFAAVKIGHEVE